MAEGRQVTVWCGVVRCGASDAVGVWLTVNAVLMYGVMC